MNPTAHWKPVAAFVSFVVAGLWIERAAVGSTDDFLKSARSEITDATVRSVLEDDRSTSTTAETRPVGASPGARPFAHAAAEPARAESAVAETRPTGPVAHRPRPAELLRGWLRRAGLASPNNRATNAAENTIAIYAPTVEAFALNSVKNDPVLPLTGEMTFTHQLLRVPGVGLDFAFALSYRSGYTYDGPVGHRWEHNWNARFQYATSGGTTRLIRYAGNRVDTYPQSTTDVFSSPAGFFEQDVRRSTGTSPKTVTRHLQDGTVETYSNLDDTNETNWYFLTSVDHRDGDNAILLYYDGDERLTRINDTRSKDFKLSYDADDRITLVADWSGGGGSADRAWALEYDAGGDLTIIKAPGSPTPKTAIRYTGTHLLAGVKAPREQAGYGAAEEYLANSYDVSNRVTKQIFGGSTQGFALSYDTANKRATEVDRAGVTRVYHYDANGAITKVAQEKDVGGTYFETLHAWDGGTRLLTKSTLPEGNGSLYQYYDGQLVATAKASASGLASPPGNLSAQASNSDYKVTSYSYRSTDRWRLLTKIKDPLGNDWQLDRDTIGNVTSYKTPEHAANPWTLGYDSRSRLSSATDPEGRAKTLAYGAQGLLTKVTVDSAGVDAQTTYGLDQYGQVTSVVDPRGQTTTTARNVRGYATAVTTPEGRATEYFYDLNDVVTAVHRDVGYTESGFNDERRTTYAYSILDVVTSVADLYGASYGSSRTRTYAYDKEDRLTLETRPQSNQLKTVYDSRGHVVTRTTAYGEAYAASEITEYDGNGRVTKTKNGLAQATTMAFDAFDRVTRVTDPESHYRTTAYDDGGNRTAEASYNSANAKLAETTLAYDRNNRLTRREQWAKKADLSTNIGSGAIVATYVYDKADLLVTKSDPCGSCGGGAGGTTIMAYDGAGRLTKTTPALGGWTVTELDDGGLAVKVSAYETGGGTTKTYVVEQQFDDDGHLTKIRRKGGGSDTALDTTHAVDAFGAVRQTTDANGNVANVKHDDLGRRVTMTRALGGGAALETYTVYDLNDNATTRICKKASGNTSVRYEFDAADRVTKTYDEGATTETLAYDKAHRVTSRTDRNGSVLASVYDGRGLLTTKTQTAQSNAAYGPAEIRFRYDGVGRVTWAYNEDALVTRTYNSLSHVETESTWVDPTNDAGAGSTQRDALYTYDGEGRVSLVAYPTSDGQFTVRRTYDALGRLTLLEKKETSGGSWYSVATWAFAGPGRIATLDYGNGARETRAYDVYGRPTRVLHDRPGTPSRPTLLDFVRGYDAGDRVQFERRDYYEGDGDRRNGTRDFGDHYRYDGADRLTMVVRGVGVGAGDAGHDDVEANDDAATDYVSKVRYVLDGAGNRQTKSSSVYSGGSESTRRREDHNFDAENQLTTRKVYDWSGSALTQTGGDVTHTFDANGSRKTGPTNKVDFENRIYEATDGSSRTWIYRYDPFGRRVERKCVTDTEVWWTRSYYDGVVPVVEDWMIDDAGDPPVPTMRANLYVRVYGSYAVDQYLWGRFDALAGNFGVDPYAGAWHVRGCVHSDFLGSVQAITEETDPTVILESYRYDEYGTPTFFWSDFTESTVSSAGQDVTYTGREWNGELGHFYYRARWYAPELGEFASRDPIASEGGSFGYTYVDSKPLNHRDEFGLKKASLPLLQIGTKGVPMSLSDLLGGSRPSTSPCSTSGTQPVLGAGITSTTSVGDANSVVSQEICTGSCTGSATVEFDEKVEVEFWGNLYRTRISAIEEGAAQGAEAACSRARANAAKKCGNQPGGLQWYCDCEGDCEYSMSTPFTAGVEHVGFRQEGPTVREILNSFLDNSAYPTGPKFYKYKVKGTMQATFNGKCTSKFLKWDRI